MTFDLTSLKDNLPSESRVNFAAGGVEGEDSIASYVYRYRNSKNAEHMHLCVVQQAMLEVITEQNLKPNSTAYFGAIMAALEQETDKEGPRNNAIFGAMLNLLAMALPKVPQQILRSKIAMTSNLLVKVVISSKQSAAQETENSEGTSGMTRYALQCLQIVLQASEKNNWLLFSPGFSVILESTVDHRPKVCSLYFSASFRVFFRCLSLLLFRLLKPLAFLFSGEKKGPELFG